MRTERLGASGHRGLAGQEIARFHREIDPRLWRVMGAALLLSLLLVAGVLAIVGLKVHQVRLSYRLDALRAARAEVEETNRRLRVELATLRSPARIESKARAELGMVVPDRDQVRLAREYVTAGGGLVGARAPRTAAAARPDGPIRTR